MTHGTTVKVVESAVRALNDKAEALGWARRYAFQKGNAAMGQQHVLETTVPHLVHPAHREPIGNTLNKAHRYLAAMSQVLSDALAERERSRTGVLLGTGVSLDPGRTTGVGIWDPDARINRSGE